MRLWMYAFLIDLWVIVSTSPAVADLCDMTEFTPDEAVIVKSVGISGVSVSRSIMVSLCEHRV